MIDAFIERTRAAVSRNPVGRFALVATTRFLDQYVIGLAQQIAYNLLFSIAPLLIFLTACISFIAQHLNRDLESPIEPVIDWITDHVPHEVSAFIDEPIRGALQTDSNVLLSFGGVVALWSAKNAIGSTMRGLNATYGIREVRPFLAHTTVAILLTLGVVVSAIAVSVLQLLETRVGEEIARKFGVPKLWNDTVDRLQVPVTLVVLVLMVLVLHRYGPTFRGPFRWYLPGAVFTILGIVVATWAFGKYFELSSGFSAYGAFGAVLALMVWLYLVSLVTLIGGVVNATLFETYPRAQRALAQFHADHPEEKHTFEQLREEASHLIDR